MSWMEPVACLLFKVWSFLFGQGGGLSYKNFSSNKMNLYINLSILFFVPVSGYRLQELIMWFFEWNCNKITTAAIPLDNLWEQTFF